MIEYACVILTLSQHLGVFLLEGGGVYTRLSSVNRIVCYQS